jgi:leucine dehydrogenase
MANMRKIYDRIEEVFRIAERDCIPCYSAADRLAEERIAALKAVPLLEPATLPQSVCEVIT